MRNARGGAPTGSLSSSVAVAGDLSPTLTKRELGRTPTDRLVAECVSVALELAAAAAVSCYESTDQREEQLSECCRRAAGRLSVAVRAVLNCGRGHVSAEKLASDLHRVQAALGDLKSELFTAACGGAELKPNDAFVGDLRHSPMAPDRNLLSKREIEVLAAIVEGQTTKEIAKNLGIAVKTAACHRYRIMDKLDLHSTAALVRFGLCSGLISTTPGPAPFVVRR